MGPGRALFQKVTTKYNAMTWKIVPCQLRTVLIRSSKNCRQALKYAFDLRLDDADVGLVIFRQHGEQIRLARREVVGARQIEITRGGAAVPYPLLHLAITKLHIIDDTHKRSVLTPLRHLRYPCFTAFSLYEVVRKYRLAEGAASQCLYLRLVLRCALQKCRIGVCQASPRTAARASVRSWGKPEDFLKQSSSPFDRGGSQSLEQSSKQNVNLGLWVLSNARLRSFSVQQTS